MSSAQVFPIDAHTCFELYRARVYRWAFALSGRHDDALDIVQDVFVRLLDRPPRLDSEAAAVGWLRRVTARLVIDRWRARKARLALEVKNARREGFSVSVERRELCQLIRRGIEGLSEQQRLVLMAKCYDRLTFAQIAQELEIAIPTAKTHYLRALAAIRTRLEPHVEAGRSV